MGRHFLVKVDEPDKNVMLHIASAASSVGWLRKDPRKPWSDGELREAVRAVLSAICNEHIRQVKERHAR